MIKKPLYVESVANHYLTTLLFKWDAYLTKNVIICLLSMSVCLQDGLSTMPIMHERITRLIDGRRLTLYGWKIGETFRKDYPGITD